MDATLPPIEPIPIKDGNRVVNFYSDAFLHPIKREAPLGGDDAIVRPLTAAYLEWWFGLEEPA